MDNDLLIKLKEGNERAYKIVFEEYYPILTAFAYKYLHDLDTSKEITQNAFVKFYERRSSIEITKNLRSYLFQIVYHDCISYLRSKAHIDLHNSQFAILQENNAECLSYIEQTEEEYKLHKLIEQLPEQCKKIFLLSWFENKKNREIAQNLNLSVRTVEAQLYKALKFLKKNYKLVLLPFLHF
jgi:RNA polymerase sigma-70 factor (family 1)